MTLTEISNFVGSEEKLTIPDLPEEYLEISLIENEECIIDEISDSYPLAVSDVTAAKIIKAEKLTEGEDVKEIYSVELSNNFTSFKPGDTVGIVTQNRKNDIEKLFIHLGIIDVSLKKCRISEKTTSSKKTIKPVFLDKITTLQYIFLNCLDIQCVPKKSLIRVLAEYTKDTEERRHLEELCSKEKSDLYTRQILETNKMFLDLLLEFPSCQPPIARLIEQLPKLMPRPYSIASSPLASPDRIRIIFSVVKINNGTTKEGLCTGMLKNMVENLGEDEFRVKLFFRKCNGFNLPDDDVPLILVGPGTGIAPFIGFLEHRKMQDRKGKIWLFYGCRHKAKDYLFEKELKEFLNCGVLSNLSVAFSRDEDSEAKYVQDNLKKYGKEISRLIQEENAVIYVCGDARNMRKKIQTAFIEIFESCRGMKTKEANDYLKQLQKEKRYLQDIWL